MATDSEWHGFSLLELPEELTILILSQLDHRSLLICCSTCRALRDIYKDSAELHIIVELGMDGLTTHGFRPTSSLDMLASIRSRRAAWMHMNFKDPRFLPELKGELVAWDVVAGIYCRMEERRLTIVNLDDAALRAEVVELDARGSRGDGVSFLDVALDPTQDVIALPGMHNDLHGKRRIQVHLKTLSTLQPFFLDDIPLSVEVSAVTHVNVELQLVDDILTVWVKSIFVPDQRRLVAWFWKDRRLAFDMSGNKYPDDTLNWTMISPRHFAFTSIPHESPAGFLLVYTFGDEQEPILTGKLSLPDVQDGCAMLSMTLHTSPYCAGLPEKDLFVTDRHKNILVLELHYQFNVEVLRDRGDTTFVLCLRNEALLDNLISDPLRTVEQLQWSDWGQRKSYLYPVKDVSEAYYFLRYVHGQRVVLPYCENASEIKILDFSSGAAEVDQRDFVTPLLTSYTFPRHEQHGYAEESSPVFKLSKEAFEGGLPHRKTQRTLPVLTSSTNNNVAGFMIDDKRIFVREYDANDPFNIEYRVKVLEVQT